MLIGRYIADGTDIAAATSLIRTFQSGWVLGAIAPAGIAFFAGVAVMAVTLTRKGGPLRWPALIFAVGAIFILAEIISAQVLLSQIGNLLLLAAGTSFARYIWFRDSNTERS